MKQMSIRSLAATAVALVGAQVLAQTGNMAVNNDGRKPHPSAILDVSSNYLPLATAEQKGMLIPRMTTAQRNALAPTVTQQGIMVYVTDAAPGFYYYEYGTWVRIDPGADGWDVAGNNPTAMPDDFLGTRDNVDFVFRTNNIEAMRVKGTPGARYVGIGTTAPAEMVDVNATIQPALGAALRIFNPSPGTWPAPTRFAATNQAGTILFRPPGTGSPGDTLFSTHIPAAPQNPDAIMWAGHWGNINGTGPQNLALPDANSGGWRKLQNDYTERAQKNYSQQGTPVCGAGFSEITFSPTPTHSNGLPAATAMLMNPYKFDVASRRWRNQYMFLAGELNVERNQLNGNVSATAGLCPGQPINTVGFWINQAITGTNATRTLQNVAVTVKHVALGVNNLSGGFDNSIDPGQACFSGAAVSWPALAGAAAWHTINLATPFVWDGVRNIIVEVAVQGSVIGGGQGGLIPGGLPVRYSTPTLSISCTTTLASVNVTTASTTGLIAGTNISGTGIPVGATVASVTSPTTFTLSAPATLTGTNVLTTGSLTYGAYAQPVYQPDCSPVTGLPGACGGATYLATALSSTCGSVSTGAFGASPHRPVIRFGGTVTTAPALTNSISSYLYYQGGFVVESTTAGNPFGRQITPYYAFKGPGTITAEGGVFDNGARLNDHVFDRAFDGRVDPDDAPVFGTMRNHSIEEMVDYTAMNRHLPTVKGRDSWRIEGGFSLGDLTNQLWTTAETQALYVTELHDRLNLLELLSTDRPISADELQQARQLLGDLQGHTDAEKQVLLKDLVSRTVNTEQR